MVFEKITIAIRRPSWDRDIAVFYLTFKVTFIVCVMTLCRELMWLRLKFWKQIVKPISFKLRFWIRKFLEKKPPNVLSVLRIWVWLFLITLGKNMPLQCQSLLLLLLNKLLLLLFFYVVTFQVYCLEEYVTSFLVILQKGVFSNLKLYKWKKLRLF